MMTSNLAALAVMRGDYERGEVLLRETIAAARDFGDPLLLSDNLVNLGDIHQFTGDFDAAMTRYNEASDILQRANDTAGWRCSMSASPRSCSRRGIWRGRASFSPAACVS